MEPLITIRGLRVAFPGVVACDDIDLELSTGEITGLVGKNGAGKSTLISVLAGATTPDSGEVLIDGEPFHVGSVREATRRGVAVVHQDIRDVATLSVAENVCLGLGFPRRAGVLVNWRALEREAHRHLARLGAGDLDPRVEVGTLSVVQQRLVTIARALAQDARLIVLDEPTASLTDSEVERLHGVMRQLRDAGVGIVFVTHRLDEVLDLSDRVVVLRNGRVVADQPVHGLVARGLVRLITGREDVGIMGQRRPTAPPDQRAAPLLEARSITGAGVRDVSLSLLPGEIVGVAGLAGSGRSQLLNLLFGADRAHSGEVIVRGKRQDRPAPRRALAGGVTLLPEDRRAAGLVTAFDIRQNVTLASLDSYRALPRLPVPARSCELRVTETLTHRLSLKATGQGQSVSTLSGGNQQKVVLAKSLARGAEIFLFDEPTHGVDVEAKEEIYAQMEQLAADGAGIVFVSSDFSELVGICHRVVVMRDGRLVDTLSGDDATEAAVTHAAYAASDAS